MSNNTDNKCGSCTACCLAPAVSKIKRPGVWCRFCNQDQGCSIYSRRPQDCRDFRCDWLKMASKPLLQTSVFWYDLLRLHGLDALRPDRLGVILDCCTGLAYGNLLQIWEVRVGGLSNVLVWDIMRDTIEQGTAVMHLYLSGKKIFFAPPSLELTPRVRQALDRERIEITTYPVFG